MQSVKLKISKLKNNSGQIAGVKKNPRIQDDAKFQKLKKSLQDFPEMLELRELVVFPLNGDFIVVGGNMRLKALKELGEKEAVCKVLPDSFPPEKINEFIIKDNVSFGLWDGAELSEWDAELLNEWGYEVPDWEFDKDWAAGLEENEMTENDIDTEEEFDPIGIAAGVQRVVFIFDGEDEAESYLKRLNVEFKKQNMAWQVNLSTKLQ